MSSGFRGFGFREPPELRRQPEGRPGSAPPFRRRRASPPRGKLASPASPRALSGLSSGGTLESLIGDTRRRRATGAGASAAIHLLLLASLLGGFLPVPSEDRALPVPPEEEALLYAFEAPPLEEEAAPSPLVEPPPELLPEETPGEEQPAPPPAGLRIPEAQIAVPSTGFQNDLPFSEGDDEEFFTDRPMGDAPEAEAESSGSASEAEPAPPVAEGAEGEPVASAALQGSPDSPDSTEAEEFLDAPGPPDLRPPLLFDADAFRERIHDPAAGVRRLADEMARSKARAQAEAERRNRKEGTPTDIWRFLEGKRFRNPEGGLVSNRNNTLYYDDRGANLVPWIGRLIAEVRRNWYIPYAASYDRGHVAIAISVLRSGEIAWLQVVIPSGVPGFDNAAVGALRGAQLLPLPDDYPGADFEIMLVFWYNERPYDLFSASP